MAHIQRQLEKNSMAHMNYLLSLSTLEKTQPDKFNTSLAAPNLILLKETRQIRALNTFILACGSEISHCDSQTSAPFTVQSQRSAGDPYGPLKKFFTSPNRVSHFDRADFVFILTASPFADPPGARRVCVRAGVDALWRRDDTGTDTGRFRS